MSGWCQSCRPCTSDVLQCCSVIGAQMSPAGTLTQAKTLLQPSQAMRSAAESHATLATRGPVTSHNPTAGSGNVCVALSQNVVPSMSFPSFPRPCILSTMVLEPEGLAACSWICRKGTDAASMRIGIQISQGIGCFFKCGLSSWWLAGCFSKLCVQW